MSGADTLIAEVLESRAGPETGAFFDLDGTLIAGYTAEMFYRDRFRRGELSARDIGDLVLALVDLTASGGQAEGPLRRAIAHWRGRPERELEETSERVFRERIAPRIYPQMRALVKAHQRRGHRVVVATSATRFQALPTARDLGIDDLLCTEVASRDGVLTGEVDGPVLWGVGKAEAVRRFAARHDLSLSDSHAYGNGDEDVPYLEVVGHPRAVNPGPVLAAVAAARAWPIRRFPDPARLAGPIPIARTTAAIAAVGATVGLGAAFGLVRRSRRDAANLVVSLASDLVLGLTGVRARVEGREHLWSRRPAVFLYNHQSGIDPFVVGSIIRKDVTAVAKKELARDPRIAPAGFVVDIVYVDRGNTAQAKQALAPVVERLRQGVSIAIAPEGTRSVTPRLGPFKKGAFHVALQAGVPIVPIVIRNSGEIMGARSNVVRPGTVDVRVLPPVETSGWFAADVDAHVAEVRQMFLDTLERWPLGDDHE